MTQTNVTVQVPTTGTPVQVVGAYANGFQVANTGLQEVWVGVDSSVSVASGLPLQPGGSTSWNAGDPLWAVASSGKPTQVTALFGANGSYAPGQAVVSISGTVPVSGSVGVSGRVTNNAGAYPSVIGSGSTSVPNSITDTIIAVLTVTDVSSYSSLSISLNMDAAANIATNPQNFISVIVSWFDTITGISPTTDNAQFLYAFNTDSTEAKHLIVPVRAQFCTIIVTANNLAAPGRTGAVGYSIVGSSYQCTHPEYVHKGSHLVPGKPSGVSVTVQGTQAATPMESTNDLGYLQVRGNSGASTGTAFLQQADSGNLVVIAEASLLANALSSDTPFIAPMRPLYLTTNQTVASLSTAVNQ